MNVDVGNLSFGQDLPLVLISGPCQLESLDHARMLAETLVSICDQEGIGYVFKASFDKANRSSLSGTRGVGIEEGLSILAAIRELANNPALAESTMSGLKTWVQQIRQRVGIGSAV